MESLFRLLSHEQSLVQEDHPDPKLVKSIEFHSRDLATTLETAKWQLEDFERDPNGCNWDHEQIVPPELVTGKPPVRTEKWSVSLQ